MREDLSGSYSVNVSAQLTRRPTHEFEVSISFGCAPDRTEALIASILVELEKIKESGLGESYTTKVKMAEQRQHEVNLKNNGFWLREIEDSLRFKDDPQLTIEYPALIETISTERIRNSARKVFDTKRFIKAVLVPGAAPTLGSTPATRPQAAL